MPSKKVVFQNSSGDSLSARLELPTHQNPTSYAIFAHCFTCNKNLTAVKNIAQALTQNGFAVLRFDFTGLGESEGDFADTNFSSNVDDLIAAAQFLKEQFEAPKLLIGHSLGGAAVLSAGSKIASIQAIATIGAPSAPDHVQHLFKDNLDEIAKNDTANVQIGGRDFKIKKQFIEDISNQNLSQLVKTLKKPILLLHSPQDTTVGINNASEIYANAMHPKSFISLDGADHLLSNKEDSIYAGNCIASWARRYIPQDEAKNLKSSKQVSVQIGLEKYTSDIMAGKHFLRADEPVRVGGKDFGPTPYDLLLASVGTCTAMTLRMYADRKQWDLTEVNVHLSHSKEHQADCTDCDNTSTKIDKIERDIVISGNLTDEQRQRLLEIADKCPVHKSLHNTIVVETKLV